MIKALIFDFDGVILDTETPWFDAYREVFEQEGGDLPLEEWAKGIGASFEHTNVFDYLSAKTGKPVDEAGIRSRTAARYKELIQRMEILPGVVDVLQTAQRMGLRIGLASSSTRKWVEGYLQQYELMPYFEVISTRDDVASAKPDPELYVRTLKLLGVSGKEAVAFEDSLNGLQAAVAAGMHVVVIPNPVTAHMSFKGESMRISSLADMPLDVLLRKLSGKMVASPQLTDHERLQQQIAFIMEIDKLKTILRQTLLTDLSRRENTAEHSWHLAVMALFLMEHANEPNLDIMRVVKMVLIHDIVEIDADDTFAYDLQGHEDKAEREQKAAERIFQLLPDDQRDELFGLWREFEERITPEAKFAAALDRLHPMLHNYYTEGAAWRRHGITSSQVYERNRHIREGSERLWELAERLIQSAAAKGYLLP